MPTYNKDIFSELDLLQARIRKKSLKLANEMASKYLNVLKFNIRSNKYGFNLSDKTIRIRLFRGINSNLPLIETGEYLDAIVRSGTRVTVKEGMHAGHPKRTGKKLSYEELSYILEYGRRDKGVKGFPVWRKTYDDFQPEVQKMLDAFAKDNLPKRKK